MKCIVCVFVLLLALSLSAQDSYCYLRVVDGDKSYVNLRVRPEREDARERIETTGCEAIRTVSFNKFLKAELTITKKEGFLLAMELNSWQKFSASDYKLNYLTNLQEEVIYKLGELFSLNYFKRNSEVLNREESILLWLYVTRIVVAHGSKKLPIDIVSRTQEITQVGELVWRSLYRSSDVSDIWIYSLHNPNQYSVNLLVDASGNLITKIMVCPELLYGKEGTLDLLELVERSSKELKSFASDNQERRRHKRW